MISSCKIIISDSVSQIRSINDCLDDGEFVAARKLLKRHEKCVEGTTKKIKESVVKMSDQMKAQRLTIASLKHEMFVNSHRHVDVDMVCDDDLAAAAQAAEESIELERQQHAEKQQKENEQAEKQQKEETKKQQKENEQAEKQQKEEAEKQQHAEKQQQQVEKQQKENEQKKELEEKQKKKKSVQ